VIPAAWRALRDLPVRAAEDGGLINVTWYAGTPPRYVVQRLHPAFKPEVHLDIEAVTAHLQAGGLRTPRLVPTDAGELWASTEEGVFRAMDFVPGVTIHRVSSPEIAAAAGALVARFHLAVDDLDWAYRHVRPGAHDTPAHMRRLADALAADATTPEAEEARPVAEAILELWEGLPRVALPDRHAHGDLKISNLRFDADGNGVCLLDLDTLSRLPLDAELGDAWRSWCNPLGEDATETAVDLEILAAAVAGYTAVRPLTADEREGLALGIERISMELASRFCRDVFEDAYFGWNRERFPSRRAHNLFRARGQLSLARSARAQRAAIARLLRG
jgi:Ser/Thr protein kinase RdoA (MazF antagonist)